MPERLEDRTVFSADLLLPLGGGENLVANANVKVSDAPGSEMIVDINPTDPLNVVGFTHNFDDQNQIQLLESWDGGNTWDRRIITGFSFDLRLMPSVNDVKDMPTQGKNLVIVASVQNVLHIRIFDADGNMAVNTGENQLPKEKAPQIEELKSLLSDLWGVPQLSQSDKDRVVTAVTSIVDYPRPGVINDGYGTAALTRRSNARLRHQRQAVRRLSHRLRF